MTPKQLPVTKTKTRKKKTCDMLLAEEAEKIKQGLAAGRPKRTPKPNKNYDWAELATFIKTEVDTPDEMDLIPVSKTSTRSLGLATRQRKQPFASVKKEDKENESPSPDADTSVFENADEYGENVSLPSHPRAPPPKPKGRPHRIRDICTQTDVLPSSSLKIPLREVKVQCNLTNEPLVSCPTCSIINWMRLEELLIDCLSKIERVFHDPLLSICLDKVLGNIEEPNHATNVLKLLSGMERDLLESPKDIILVSSQDEEVEIENVIHPEVEAPVTGVREITPKLWQAKVKLKTEDDDDEEVLKVDPDGLGLQEATELDDEEFQPDFPDADEDEDEEQELDDEEWSISRRDSDSGVSSKRKQKKMQLRHKKEQSVILESAEVCCRYCRREFAHAQLLEGHRCRGRTSGDRRFPCTACEPGDNRSPCEVKECWPSFMEPRDTSQRRSGSSASTEDPQSGFYAGSLEKNGSHTNAWLQKKCRSERVGTLRSNTGSHGVCESPQGSGPHRKMSYRQNMSDRQDVSDSGGSTRSARYSCDECGKVFTQRQAVRYHKVWRHNAERRGPCPHCHYKAPDTTKLRLHIKKVHRGYMPYKCRFCPKQFKCHSNHKEHEARHQGEGDFECHLCDKKFALQSSLARHVRYHKGERPFCCHHCGKSFKSKPHLQRHITCLHLKEKRVVCEVCGAAHHNNWNLKIHMKTHQVSDHNREHICSHCGSQFKNSSSLMVHIRKVHTVTVVQSSKTADVEVQTPESSGKQLTSIFEEPARKTKDELAHQEDTEGSLIVIGEVLSSTPPQMTEHRTIVIDGGSQDNLQQLPEGFAYNDFTEDSSMHTLELYSCDACFMVFQSEGELLQHNCTHTFTTSY
ncbi:hypothetical protein OTU49_001692 [Cherax quadricarinatus]|uniref:C2H2-type domain-containing protein n=1 Tax=Cherax quadricarinatus TaxID=27406 RepID=A0AAW0XSM6_CHEQU